MALNTLRQLDQDSVGITLPKDDVRLEGDSHIVFGMSVREESLELAKTFKDEAIVCYCDRKERASSS